MLLINRDDAIQWRYGFFSDLLVWCIGLRKVKIFWIIVQYVHIGALTVHWIGSRIVHNWKRYDLSSLIVQYVRICVSNEVTDGITYCTSMSQLHITPHMDMLIHVHSISISIFDEVVWCFPKVPCVQAHSLSIL